MAFTDAQKQEIKRRWCETTDTAVRIGEDFGVSKNVIIGMARRAGWQKMYGDRAASTLQNRYHGSVEPRTLFDRCADLHARFDAIVAEANGKRLTLPQPAKKAAAQ
jgi:hypothetical protein